MFNAQPERRGDKEWGGREGGGREGGRRERERECVCERERGGGGKEGGEREGGTESQPSDTGPTSRSAMTPGAWQGSH